MTDSRLEQVAGENPRRKDILQQRRDRCRARRKSLICRTCGESDWDERDPSDVCDSCLIAMWNADDVLTGAYKAGKRSGLVAIKVSDRDHWFPYPHLGPGDNLRPERDAPFARRADAHTFHEVESPSRIVQTLYWELFTALSQALPCDPGSRHEAIDPFNEMGENCSNTFDSVVALRMPREAVKALMDLWRFIRWQSHAAYFQGFEAGRGLITGLATGTHTAETMANDVVEQTRLLQDAMARTKIVRKKEKRR